MKYGILTFSYSNFAHFAEAFRHEGAYSVNLGDNMQSLALRHLYARIGIADGDVVSVDRDTLAHYRGEPVALPMNGCFYRWCFPLPETIVPIFLGFQAKETVVRRILDLLKRHQPIGCRDLATEALLRRHGIAAFTTGCLTLSLPARTTPPTEGRVFVVYGTGAGAFPAQALASMPSSLLARAEFVSQRKLVHTHPLGPARRAEAEAHARRLLEEYRARADLVVTPLHHAAAPALASGIPVVLCRAADDPRFSTLRELLPLYLPEAFPAIDWAPRPVDLSRLKSRQESLLREALARATGRD